MFAGKHGYITLRDLFRWAERYRMEERNDSSCDWLQHLADDGNIQRQIFDPYGVEHLNINSIIQKFIVCKIFLTLRCSSVKIFFF